MIIKSPKLKIKIEAGTGSAKEKIALAKERLKVSGISEEEKAYLESLIAKIQQEQNND